MLNNSINYLAIASIVQLLGHKHVETTMIYTHVLNRGGKGIRSPADGALSPLAIRIYPEPDKTVSGGPRRHHKRY